MLTALTDVFFSITDVCDEVAVVEACYLYKGKGEDALLVQPFRPLGLASPILALLVDVMHLRAAVVLRTCVGPRQLGGTRDARFHLITSHDCRVRRNCMDFPTLDVDGDARFGYDDGRRAQVLIQIHRAGAAAREWLLFEALLTK